MKNKLIVISLGGSLIAPGDIDWHFLKKFKDLILKMVQNKYRFIIITGGGQTARKYQSAIAKIGVINGEDRDWIGIHSTRLNGHLLRTIFRKYAHPRINKNPYQKFDFREKILIGAGWKPGFSTDLDAVILAKEYGAKTLINLSNIDYVYTKDPRKFKDAKKIKEIAWKDFRRIVGDKWDPGLNAPFDPVASKMAEEMNMEVVILNGKKLKNFESCLVGRKFQGTVIKYVV
ncbi:MAG TPA: UMP kinase [Candidatus Bathyarchaeia archaeon]|nr:UMP kinase [Candidatus Bathyarchaeia archaeon]